MSTTPKNDIRSRADIDELMLRFYSRALADDKIGFIFTDVAKLDLDHHLPIIGDFWETIVFQTGTYARHGRNPLMVHGELASKTSLLPEHFQRWLLIFRETTDELFAGDKADFIKMRALAIASRMQQYVTDVAAQTTSSQHAAGALIRPFNNEFFKAKAINSIRPQAISAGGKVMSQYLNHELGFEEVRWATMRKTSYDVKKSFGRVPEKIVLYEGTLLYRLIQFPTGKYFDAVWWMPKMVFDRIRNDTNRHPKGDGEVFRDLAGRLLALPSASTKLGVVEIELVRPVNVWSGGTFGLFEMEGGVPQVYLPHLAEPGDPQFSPHARVVRTYWLRFEKW